LTRCVLAGDGGLEVTADDAGADAAIHVVLAELVAELFEPPAVDENA